ncbi:hypothetical protein F4779DRAFT_612252 [Xylariaceae sp. FL0662B]|nr:hypothetical protein F4779DRAFT_612252 [Xylariaceae sp. FL0662B]
MPSPPLFLFPCLCPCLCPCLLPSFFSLFFPFLFFRSPFLFLFPFAVGYGSGDVVGGIGRSLGEAGPILIGVAIFTVVVGVANRSAPRPVVSDLVEKGVELVERGV